MATLNTALTAAFLGSGARCFLIKRAADSGTRWTVVKELTAGWFVDFSEFRQQFKLLYATDEATFVDEIAQTSFVAYGTPDGSNRLEVFSIDPERRDIIPPTGTNPFWKIYVDKVPSTRFTII